VMGYLCDGVRIYVPSELVTQPVGIQALYSQYILIALA
jgi:hypothetical protein